MVQFLFFQGHLIPELYDTVSQKLYSFSSILSKQSLRPLKFRSTPFNLFSSKLIFKDSKSESQCDISVFGIGDILSYGLPQNE